ARAAGITSSFHNHAELQELRTQWLPALVAPHVLGRMLEVQVPTVPAEYIRAEGPTNSASRAGEQPLYPQTDAPPHEIAAAERSRQTARSGNDAGYCIVAAQSVRRGRPVLSPHGTFSSQYV